MGHNVDPGRPSEVLQAETKTRYAKELSDAPKTKAPEAPEKKKAEQAPPPPPVAKKVEAPPMDVDKAVSSGKLPLQALPDSELAQVAKKYGVKTPGKRDEILDALKKKGVTEVATEK